MKNKLLLALLASLLLATSTACNKSEDALAQSPGGDDVYEESRGYSLQAVEDYEAEQQQKEQSLLDIPDNPTPETALPGPLPEGEDGSAEESSEPDFTSVVAMLEEVSGVQHGQYLLGDPIPTYIWDGESFSEQTEVANHPIYGDGKIVGIHMALENGSTSFYVDDTRNPAIEAGVEEFCEIIYGGKTYLYGSGKLMLLAEIDDAYGPAITVPDLTVNDLVNSIISENPAFEFNTDQAKLASGALQDITPA